MEDINAESTVIAVMGMTGVGKSSFISLLTEQEVPIGSDLESCTEVCGIYKCKLPGDSRIFWIADTPGFDDSKRSDYEILRELSSWLAKSYSESVKLTGIIYLHRIMDNRLGGTAMRNLRMFKKLVGEENLDSIVLATTFWSQVDEATGKQREYQLANTEEFWAGMIGRGSTILRHDKGNESALTIVRYLLNRKSKATYAIQKELIDDKKPLDETAAGGEVQEQVEKLRLKYEKKIDDLRKEMAEAIQEKDLAAQRDIASLRAEHEAWIAKQEEEQEKAAARAEELWRTREAEREQIQASHREELLKLQLEYEQSHKNAMKSRYDQDLQIKLQLERQRLEMLRLKEKAERSRCSVM